MIKHKSKKGVTLLELIITLGLIGVITALAFFFFGTNQRAINTVGLKSDLQYEAKKVIDSFSKYAMEATSGKIDQHNGDICFNLITDNGQKILNGAVFTKSNSTLKLLLKDESGNVTEAILSEYIEQFNGVIDTEKGGIAIDMKLKKKDIGYSIKENYLFRNSHLN